jgi:hypothetical protein
VTELSVIQGGVGESGFPTVQLGNKTFEVIPQSHAYIGKKIPKAFEGLGAGFDGDLSIEGLHAHMGGSTHKLLKVFIPRLMPEWEFMGYATQRAQEEGEYDEDADHAPSVPQIRRALEVCFEVNGLDLVKHLKNFVRLDLLRATINNELASLVEARLQSSSAATTDIPSTSSGTTGQTSTGNGDSPGRESTPSSKQPESVESAS